MFQKMSYAIIGGDTRQIYLLLKLMESGASCISYGLSKEEMQQIFRQSSCGYKCCKCATSPVEAITAAKCILGPIPLCQDCYINSKERLKASELLNLMQPDQSLFAGCIDASLKSRLEQKGIYCRDYMKAEEISLYNSIATAEGILAEAITSYPYNLHKRKCLVIGYGRCGKTLADKLKGLGTSVTICARKSEVLSYADCLGYEGIHTESLKDLIHDYDLIFNTVPHLILTSEILRKVSARSHIYDLASKPGGVDWLAAKSLGLHAASCLGLPGKYAPAASADALYNYIIRTQADQ